MNIRAFPKTNATCSIMRTNPIFLSVTLFLFSIGTFWGAGGAEQKAELPFVHPLFSDHVVLQRGAKVPVWGWAAPGAEIKVQFAGQTKSGIADADGKWMIRLSPLS